MRLIDLSHTVTAGMTTYPGLPGPAVSDHLSRADSHANYAEGTEFQIGRIEMVGNTGTYLDTPFHRYADGFDLSALALDRVALVPAVLVDASAEGPGGAGGRGSGEVGADAFAGLDLAGRAVLVRTGWDRHWGTPAYGDVDHPHITADGAAALVDAGAAIVGIDSVNIDGTATGERPAHSALLAAGIPIVEHLCRLDQLPADGPFTFTAVPVKVAGMGTFPVRAFATVD